MDHEALAQSFRESARREFAFLEAEFGFSVEETKPRYVRYRSPTSVVHIYHDGNFGLHVEFGPSGDAPAKGIERSFLSRLFGWKSPQDTASTGNRNFKSTEPLGGIPEVLLAFADRQTLPPDIREM